ncbi:MAG TPA: phospho-N-acetylmuramoyl-pentapeptide-transferase [Anaerolineae bacterium]|nr:phospho-N-acetylmuramoyl-pentapeptide-transferase [Anaerolineae bacterium]
MHLITVSYSLGLTVIAFLITAWGYKPFIAFLREHQIGKQISVWGPATHRPKAGTPTMGGILALATIVVLTVAFNLIERYSMLLPLGVIISYGALGALDDMLTLIRAGREEGFSPGMKTALLLLLSILVALLLHFVLGLTSVYLPGLGKFDIGHWYLPIAVFILLGSANAVNFADGLDGLAAGLLVFAFLAYGLIAFLQGQLYLVTFCFTVVGALLGFLWFNVYPAEVFMGDTGSLALGATLATVALMTGQWLLLPLVGIVFVVETLSVIIQKAYRFLYNDERLFRMAPIHHHFELSGWSETKVTLRFWILGLLGGLLGIALALV